MKQVYFLYMFVSFSKREAAVIDSERQEIEEYTEGEHEIRKLTVLEISSRRLERERLRSENDRRKVDREFVKEPVL